MIDQQVLQYIKAKKLFTDRDKILVAVSGGADSVALLRILHAARFRCEAAHCNFHLRGAESDRDEEFVRCLCKQCDIALHTAHFDTSRYAAEKHLSIEMAARELRYRWFENMRQACGAKVVAVAHHRDDSVETMLLNLVRGTGIAGLQGIRPVNGTVVRPLLCVGRNEICAYLDSIGQPYVTDSTNLENKYTRNKIRNCLLPLMEEVNPSVKACLAETGNRLGEIAAIYEKSIAEAKKRVSTPQGIDIGKLLEETAPRAVLFEMLHPLGFNSAQVRDVFESLTGQPGKQFHSNDWRAVKDRGMLLLMPKNVKVDTPSFRLEKEEQVLTPDFQIPRDKSIACFDAEKLKAPVIVRLWRTGDTFVPFGMRGKKKVSDYLTDRKFSLSQKEQQWVLCSGERIAWLIGERIDQRFCIDPNTRNVTIYKMV